MFLCVVDHCVVEKDKIHIETDTTMVETDTNAGARPQTLVFVQTSCVFPKPQRTLVFLFVVDRCTVETDTNFVIFVETNRTESNMVEMDTKCDQNGHVLVETNRLLSKWIQNVRNGREMVE